MAEFELGGRYVRPVGERSRLELLLSQRQGTLEALSQSWEGDDEERFQQNTDTGETLLRADVGHEYSRRLRLSAGLEGAFNFLEGDARLSENGEQVELPGSEVRIEERRAEASLAAAWQPGGVIVGFDMGVDKSGNVWMIEANPKPALSLFKRLKDPSMYRQIVSYPRPY